jgi:hypothetical protein
VTWAKVKLLRLYDIEAFKDFRGSDCEMGLAWLEQIFDGFTKKKAGRSYRSLILDRHESYITMDSIEYHDRRMILLMAFPPVQPTLFNHLMW